VQKWVFPTHVGVFLMFHTSTSLLISFPHARGGVSKFRVGKMAINVFSPRTWGCFWGC